MDGNKCSRWDYYGLEINNIKQVQGESAGEALSIGRLLIAIISLGHGRVYHERNDEDKRKDQKIRQESLV